MNESVHGNRRLWWYGAFALLQVAGARVDRQWHAVHPGAEAGWGMAQAHSLLWIGAALFCIVALHGAWRERQVLLRALNLLIGCVACAALTGMGWDWYGHTTGVAERGLEAPHALVGYGMIGIWTLVVVLALVQIVLGQTAAAVSRFKRRMQKGETR